MAEASVAAPFTSRNVHIGCVPYLIREGRATMVSAFASYKFGVAFGFTQLIAVLIVFYVRDVHDMNMLEYFTYALLDRNRAERQPIPGGGHRPGRFTHHHDRQLRPASFAY